TRARHPQIGDHHVDWLLAHQGQRRGGVGRVAARDARLGELRAQHLAHSRIVVDDQNVALIAVLHVCLHGYPKGRNIRTVVPAPSLLINETSPPCASATRRTNARPSPLPVALVVKKSSSARSRVRALIPMPTSSTDSRTPRVCPAFTSAVRTVTVAGAATAIRCDASSAFCSRFSSAPV